MKYDVTICLTFRAVEAKDSAAAAERCDKAIDNVIARLPPTDEGFEPFKSKLVPELSTRVSTWEQS